MEYVLSSWGLGSHTVDYLGTEYLSSVKTGHGTPLSFPTLHIIKVTLGIGGILFLD